MPARDTTCTFPNCLAWFDPTLFEKADAHGGMNTGWRWDPSVISEETNVGVHDHVCGLEPTYKFVVQRRVPTIPKLAAWVQFSNKYIDVHDALAEADRWNGHLVYGEPAEYRAVRATTYFEVIHRDS